MAELEERQAKIEGILEQIDKRLTRVESEVEGLRTEISNLHTKIDSKISALDAKIDSNFRWQMGVMFTMWVTIILAVLIKG